ncbi:hypothetical protein EYV94_10560 [Puteibacter caeruleilacunae]|nr:hypothetical protein EYV94_10560 [Puteibacter caeruleilacunae]
MKIVLMRRLAVLVWILLSANVYSQHRFGHMVPEQKKLSSQWEKSLFVDDERKVYRGEELTTIGMPVGGIGAGQLYVRGDGTLACWWIANNAYNTGPGRSDEMNFNTPHGPWKVCYQSFEPFSYFKQGFKLQVERKGKTIAKSLNKHDFDNIGFVGEYPIAKVSYESNTFELPVAVEMEAFSPFIPMQLRESANPATILKFKLKNTSKGNVSVNLTGFIQNMVMADLKGEVKGVVRTQDRSTYERKTLFMDCVPDDPKYQSHPYYGNMSLSLLNHDGSVDTGNNNTKAIGDELVGEVTANIKLAKGEEKSVVFLLSWYFPNRPMEVDMGWDWNKPIKTKGLIRGNMYANWYSSSLDVADYIDENYESLTTSTYQFHHSWYEKSTLPYWLKQRILMPASILATETVQWYADNKFMLWEGVGSCYGNCTHVYNYAQATANLFPEIERSIREKSDFLVSFQKDGAILSRDGRERIFMDGHLGAILKAYREHLNSKDNLFLSRNWPKIKKAMGYAINEDGNADGLMETTQSNTYDINFSGANTYVGSLYLAALKACEQMALIISDKEFAQTCNDIAAKGSRLSVERLWNGHYFIQDVDLEKHPKYQYAKGCLSDQLFGQTWSYLLNLGSLYEEEKVNTTYQSIWKYNWTPDVGPQAKKYTPERDYAVAGEPGLFICTWPFSEHMNKNGVRYRNEVWTGIEYQVATGMIYNGMLKEGLSLVKAVHERYRPEKHNPWNEIECGDHYGRAMASWGVLKALEGYHYNGPKGIMKFDPRLKQADYCMFFTAAEGWGSYTQSKDVITLTVDFGIVYINELDIPGSGDAIVTVNGQKVSAQIKSIENKLQLTGLDLSLDAGDILKITQLK